VISGYTGPSSFPVQTILVTLAIFTFMGTWNDFLWPLIVMTDDSMYTLPGGQLANLSLEHVQDTSWMMAGSVMTDRPVLILFGPSTALLSGIWRED